MSSYDGYTRWQCDFCYKTEYLDDFVRRGAPQGWVKLSVADPSEFAGCWDCCDVCWECFGGDVTAAMQEEKVKWLSVKST